MIATRRLALLALLSALIAAPSSAQATAPLSMLELAHAYGLQGFEHILPLGLDHILFILAIFLSTKRLKSLLAQVSAFTIAHTAALAIVALGYVPSLPHIIEPLIALTIVWAASENLRTPFVTAWRPVLVFAFGLLHGMGFASGFAGTGMPPSVLAPALVGFNIGVELGQLCVLGTALALGLVIRFILRAVGRTKSDWRRFVVRPGSFAIMMMGFWWAVLRLVP